MRHIWVVEVDFQNGKGYTATVGVALTREEGKKELHKWKVMLPNDPARLVKYTSPVIHTWIG